MTALSYIVKTGACTLTEMSALMRSDKASSDTLKKWGVEEMQVLGIPIDGTFSEHHAVITGVVKE